MLIYDNYTAFMHFETLIIKLFYPLTISYILTETVKLCRVEI